MGLAGPSSRATLLDLAHATLRDGREHTREFETFTRGLQVRADDGHETYLAVRITGFPGAWRVLALDTAAPHDRLPDLAATPASDGSDRPAGLVWSLHPGYVLRPEDRVVLAATRQGLAELLGRRPRLGTRRADA